MALLLLAVAAGVLFGLVTGPWWGAAIALAIASGAALRWYDDRAE